MFFNPSATAASLNRPPRATFTNLTPSFNLYKLQLGILFIPYWKFIGTRSDLLEAEKLMKEDITKIIKSRTKFFYKEKYIKETRYY